MARSQGEDTKIAAAGKDWKRVSKVQARAKRVSEEKAGKQKHEQWKTCKRVSLKRSQAKAVEAVPHRFPSFTLLSQSLTS